MDNNSKKRNGRNLVGGMIFGVSLAMKICKWEHEEIVYLCKSCPICEANIELVKLQKTIFELMNINGRNRING